VEQFVATLVEVDGGGAFVEVPPEIVASQQLAKAPGDRLVVELERDDEERRVDVPDDLASALVQAGEREAFDRLSFSHRREYVAWIDEAKKPETRARRIAQTVERVRDA